MAFSTSSKDGWSHSSGMIYNVGRSSSKPGSVMWTLLSRFCRYSAHLARINSLFLINTPSVICMSSRGDVVMTGCLTVFEAENGPFLFAKG